MNLKEVGGGAEIRSYWTQCIDGSDGLIWVIDSTDRNKIDDSKTELHKLLEDSKLAGNPLIVFCNKEDQEGMRTAEISEYLQLNKIEGRQWSTVSCSAVNGKGLTEGLDYVTYIKFIKDRKDVALGFNPF